MAKHYRSKGSLPPYRLTIIDRWPINDGLVSTFAKNIEQELAKVEPSKRDQVLLLFTAHSLPLKVSGFCCWAASGVVPMNGWFAWLIILNLFD